MKRFAVNGNSVFFYHENGQQYQIGEIATLSSIAQEFSEKLESGELELDQVPCMYPKRSVVSASTDIHFIG